MLANDVICSMFKNKQLAFPYMVLTNFKCLFLVVITFTAHKLAKKLFKCLLNSLHAFLKNEDKKNAEEDIEKNHWGEDFLNTRRGGGSKNT
jgi:hypothetical protein